MEHTKTPWTVYRCNYADEEPGSACGLNGVSFDCSHDECHHPLTQANAAFIVQAVNNYDQLIKALEYCAYGPGELRPENQAQFMVARAALEKVKT